MKTYLFILGVICSFFAGLQGVAQAITLTASPSPASVNQSVSITVLSSIARVDLAPNCTIEINFGDGSPWTSLPACTAFSCTRTTSYTYTTPGQYTITARSKSDACNLPPVSPDPATAILTVQCTSLAVSSPSPLPQGMAGSAYSYQIQAAEGMTPYTYSITGGSLPPELTLAASGLISGMPAAAGNHNFTITAADSCAAGAQTAQKAFTITINPEPCAFLSITSSSILPTESAGQPYARQILTRGGQPPVSFNLASASLPTGLSINSSGLISGTPTAAGTFNFSLTAADQCAAGLQQVQMAFSIVISADLRVTASPSVSRIARNMAWTQNLFYSFSSPSTAPITLTSDRGVFTANNRVIGEANTPLNVAVTNGIGNVSEVLNVPVDISKRAEQAGTSRIIYTRTFTGGTLSIDAQTEIIVTTGAASEFTITRLQLYFKNQRAEITVNRNQPFLKAFADILFSGSGLLTGYWEVDGRILEYVSQHLVYGSCITLVSPKIPSLPTYSPGTHIVRFVISQPSKDIPIPQALYFVTSEESSQARFIALIMPENYAGIMRSPVFFEWQNLKWADTYLIAFFDKTDEKPIFSAYTRENSYRLPELILNRLFAAGGVYQWQVRGFDAGGNIIGESPLYQFAFSE